jgi:hypothetical protein
VVVPVALSGTGKNGPVSLSFVLAMLYQRAVALAGPAKNDRPRVAEKKGEAEVNDDIELKLLVRVPADRREALKTRKHHGEKLGMEVIKKPECELPTTTTSSYALPTREVEKRRRKQATNLSLSPARASPAPTTRPARRCAGSPVSPTRSTPRTSTTSAPPTPSPASTRAGSGTQARNAPGRQLPMALGSLSDCIQAADDFEAPSTSPLIRKARWRRNASQGFTVGKVGFTHDANGELVRLQGTVTLPVSAANYLIDGKTGYAYFDNDVVSQLRGLFASKGGTVTFTATFGFDMVNGTPSPTCSTGR